MRWKFFIYLLILPISVIAQDSLSLKAEAIPDKYFHQVTKKSLQYQRNVEKRTQRALDHMMHQERKLQAKLAKVDTLAAKSIFSNSLDTMMGLKERITSTSISEADKLLQSHGYLDTLTNTLGFLKDAKSIPGNVKNVQAKLIKPLAQVKELQGKLQQAESVRKFIRARRDLLQAQLGQYSSMSKDLQKINKEVYYYNQQLQEYKFVFSDRKKAEAKAMELLRKVPAYKDFIARNSQIAHLFSQLQGGSGVNPEQQLEGLQTRVQVEQLIQQQLGNGGPNASQAIRQQMDAARSQLNELRSRFPELDNAAEMPDFKPNEMKTKSFMQRLELGCNVQFQRSNQFFPSTSDFAGQIGYKFSKNGIIGIGASYKLGLGTGFSNIRFSHQGMGLRSFGDYKLKGTFFVNGGYEYNYNAAFLNPGQFANTQVWTRSALLGIAKKYKINNKLKGNMTLLYDFLHNAQVPRTDPVKFRLGYNF